MADFLRYEFGGLIFGGAYTWRGLFSEFYGILFLKSACVNMVMQIQVQIGDTRTVFLRIRQGVLRI